MKGMVMKEIGNFVKWFLYITVGIFVVCGISYKLAGMETVSVDVFGMIFLSAFVTTLVTVIMIPREDDGKVKTIVKFVMHYIVLCIIMSFLGVWFGWMPFDLLGIGVMVADVAGVYLLTFGAYYIIDVKQADEINKMLKQKYGE